MQFFFFKDLDLAHLVLIKYELKEVGHLFVHPERKEFVDIAICRHDQVFKVGKRVRHLFKVEIHLLLETQVCLIRRQTFVGQLQFLIKFNDVHLYAFD